MKKITILTGVLVLLLHTSCDWNKKKKEHEEETKFLITSPLRKEETKIIKEYVCQIKSIQHIELRALEKGYLENIYVDEGQFVKKGQIMFQIMPRVYEAECAKAKAEANLAEIEYQNTKKLSDKNIVSKNELAMAKAKYDKAKAELSLAQVHLDFTKIKAPFDGIIDRFRVRRGSLVDEGDLLNTLSDNSNMWVYFNVPEAEYLDYQQQLKGNKSKIQVKLLMANNKIFDKTGIVETIEAEFNNETGNIPFRATFPNPKGLLRHGETGNVLVTKTIKNALLIPQKATFEILDKKYVFVIDDDNVVRSKQITISAEIPDIYIVGEGLEGNEKILLEGLRKVRDEDKIEIEFKNPEEVLANLKLYSE